MAIREVGEGNASAETKHSVRVDWFRREPGGGTVFVKPAKDEETTVHPVTDLSGPRPASSG